MNDAKRGMRVLLLAGSGLLALAWTGPARADDEPTREPAIAAAERLEALRDTVAEHRRARDSEALVADIKRVVVLYGEAPEDEKVRKECVRLLGGLTRARGGCATVAVAAFEGLGTMADPEGARYVKTRLRRMRRDETASAPMKAAVAAAANLCSDDLIDPLLNIVTESKDVTLAAQAVQALGHFRQCKRKRVKILKTLVETIAKDRPGLKGRSKDPVPGDQYRHTGDLARQRWAALSKVLPGALLQLTNNQSMKGATADWWIEAVRNHKRDLDGLFDDEEE